MDSGAPAIPVVNSTLSNRAESHSDGVFGRHTLRVNELAEFQELQEFHHVELFSVKFGEVTDTKTDTVLGRKVLAQSGRECNSLPRLSDSGFWLLNPVLSHFRTGNWALVCLSHAARPARSSCNLPRS